MDVELGPGVANLLQRHGEAALTVELTVDFELDARKTAIAFPGPSEPSLGFRCVRVDGLDVWWRQRLVVGAHGPRLTDAIRPRRLLGERVGDARSAQVDYA